MFLLTEGTLFFLDLTFNARTCGQKPSLSSVVQKWVDEVAAAGDSDDSDDGVHTTTGASSTLFAPPPAYSFGEPTGTPQNTHASSKISFLADDEYSGENAMNHYSEASVSISGTGCTDNGCGGDCCNARPDASFSQQHQEVRRGTKRKLDVVYEIESDANGGDNIDSEDTVPEDASHFAKMKPIGIKIKSSMLQPQKRVRCVDASVSLLFVPPDSTLDGIPPVGMAQPLAPRRRQVDNAGYIIEVTKKPSEYTTRDLPIPCDQRWSQSFISTAILWYSVQKNVWNVPKAELASALQRIFNVVYPDIKYRVTPTGAVFALTIQRIHEWRSSFGSSALAMMLHFFSALDNAGDIHAAAEFLATDFRFLRADPDACEPTEQFRSPFLFILLAITHLSDVAACVDVPGWDTRGMAAGESGEGVVAIASAALERALTLFRNGTLNAEHALAETARVRCQDALLPNTVLHALAGHDAPPALRFSSANWSGHTAAYRNAVRKRGAAFVRATFDAAQAKRRRIVGAGDEDGGGESDAGARSSAGVSAVPDPRALL